MTLFQNKQYQFFLYYLPFLVLYAFIVYLFHTDEMIGDEGRYIQFTKNLLKGFYSPPAPDINLINGPGYPLFLIPFVALNVPLICITLFNAVFHYLSVVFLCKSLCVFLSRNKAIAISICWGFYFLAYQEMPSILSEYITVFLISLFIYTTLKSFSAERFKLPLLILSGFLFGYIVLTKVIFGYVLVLLFVYCLILFIRNRSSILYKKGIIILSAALLTILPYIIYTHSLTGRIFYLSTEGGKVLYWMTSISEKEYGDWNNMNFNANCMDPEAFCNADLIRKNHEKDFEKIMSSQGLLSIDDAFKEIALNNIKTHPIKYIKNWFANIGRLLFGFPASYYFQTPTSLVRVFVNSFLLVFVFISLLFSLKNWKRLPFAMCFIMLFAFLYLGLSSLVSAYPRQFNVVVPVLLLWISYCFDQSIQLKINWNKEAKNFSL